MMAQSEDWMPNVQQVEDGSQAMVYVRSLFAEGRIEEARAELRSMIEREPDNARPLVALGLSLLRERQLEEAAQLFERAMQLDPENEVPALLAAQVGIRGDNPEYAEVHFHKALAINPNSQQALTGLARLHLRNDRLDEAIAVLERAIEIDPQSRALRHQIAAICSRQGRYDEAREHLHHLLSIYPDDEQSSIQLAGIYQRMGEANAALELLRRAHEAHPDHPGLMVALGDALISVGEPAEAETILRRAVDMPRTLPEMPQQTPAGSNPAGAEMMRRLAEWWQRRPRIFAQMVLIRALIPQNKLSEARGILARMPRQGPMGAMVQRLYGDAFAFEGNTGAAEQSYRAALHAMRGGEAKLREIDARKAADNPTGEDLLTLYTDALQDALEEQMTQLSGGSAASE